jgi:hypothetical protein
MRPVHMALLAALLVVPARGQEPTSITLLCTGTSKLMTAGDDAKADLVTNLGMIVNFGERTVSFLSYRIPFERIDDTMVLFHGTQAMSYAGSKLKPVTVDGSVDRVTGAASVEFMNARVGDNQTWDLMCKPTKQLFQGTSQPRQNALHLHWRP